MYSAWNLSIIATTGAKNIVAVVEKWLLNEVQSHT